MSFSFLAPASPPCACTHTNDHATTPAFGCFSIDSYGHVPIHVLLQDVRCRVSFFFLRFLFISHDWKVRVCLIYSMARVLWNPSWESVLACLDVPLYKFWCAGIGWILRFWGLNLRWLLYIVLHYRLFDGWSVVVVEYSVGSLVT